MGLEKLCGAAECARVEALAVKGNMGCLATIRFIAAVGKRQFFIPGSGGGVFDAAQTGRLLPRAG
jgi:hypothetical protein